MHEDRCELFEHLRWMDLAQRLLLDLGALVDGFPEIEPAAKAMGNFAADMIIGEDPEAAALLRDWAAPERGPLARRLARVRSEAGDAVEGA
jgi:hypothetical protein